MDFGKLRLVLYIMAFVNVAALVTPLMADNSVTTAVTSQLCSIVNAVRTIVGILALTLFLIGGVLYAVSHFLPTNLEFKKSLTVWSQGMIIGGLVGLVIVLIAQPIIGLITQIGVSAGGSSITSITC
jgi:hypothetical protein